MSIRTPKCNKGFPCGKTCISRKRLCWANLSSNNSRLAETFSQFVNRLVGIGNSIASTVVLPIAEPHKIREPNQNEVDALEDFFNKSKFFTEKLNKVQTEFGLEKLEAMGLALWISNEYSGMNTLLYNENVDYNKLNEKQLKFVAANFYADKALKSGLVPKYTRENMVNSITDVSLNYKLNPDNNLSRGLNMYGAEREKLVKYYQENIGKEIVDKTFFATTAFSPDQIGFTEDADILFNIKPKENGSGFMVDKGKNSMFEAEVLYAPGTKFKVDSIDTKVSTPNYLLPEEKLDEIFTSSPINETIREYIPDKNNYKALQLMSILGFLTFDFDAQGFTAIKFIKDRFPYLSDQQIEELLGLRVNLTDIDQGNYKYIEKKGGIHIEEKFTINLEEI